jgi:hypothetical protein
MVFMFLGASLAQSEENIKELRTKDGALYSGITIIKQEPDGLVITHSAGESKIPFELLPEYLKLKYKFDPEKVAEFRKQEEKPKEEESDLWEPYSSILASPHNPEEYARKLQSDLLKIQNCCEPLLEKKKVSKELVKAWCDAVFKKSIAVGMPQDLVLVSWGEPNSINDNSYGAAQWIYRVGDFKAQYIYMKDGVVKSWQNSR